jgi:transglutaminase-like putative cysteine protease
LRPRPQTAGTGEMSPLHKGKAKKKRILKSLLRLYAVSLTMLLIFLTGSCLEKTPEISSIDPSIGRMGEVLTIRGSGFGDERSSSFITIAGASPTSSSYLSWSDNEIAVRAPEFGEAGLVYVHRGGKKSNPAMFANISTLPESVSGAQIDNSPVINSIEPSSAPIGSLITIHGSNFGASRETGGVFFSWIAEVPPAAQGTINPPDFVEVFQEESGYESWSEREIRVRIPDGAVSGNLEIRTARGKSRPIYFEVTGKPGTKIYKDKKTYTLSYSAEIQVKNASVPNALYVWIPRPALSASQRNVTPISRTSAPFVDNYRGVSLFQFHNTPSGSNLVITLSYETDVYAIETNIRNTAVVRLNRPLPMAAADILPSALIPSEDQAVRTQVRTIIGTERLPFPKAQRIYNWLVSTVKVQADPLSNNALEALEGKIADSFSASLLFCALARATEIPAQPVAGVIVDRFGNTTKHYWAEFWLDGFGWVPLDPALGAGAFPAEFSLREDHASYYFGNLDNQRIAFSRGEHFLSQMTPRGRIASRDREYSMQNIWEEAVEGIGTYSSFWSDVTITGMRVP